MMKTLAITLLLIACLGCAHDWDRTDTTLAAMSVAASALDAYTTEAGDFDGYIHPLMDDGNICLVIGVTELAVIGASFFLPKKMRRALFLSNITLRVGCSTWNLSQ